MELGIESKRTETQANIIGYFTIVCASVVIAANLPGINLILGHQVAVYALLSFVAQLMPARLPQGSDFSVAFIIDLVLISLYGTQVAVIACSTVTFAALLVYNVITHGVPFFKVMVRTGQAVLIVGIAGTVQSFAAPDIVSFTLASCVYFLSATFFISLESVSGSKHKFFSAWISVMRTVYLTYFVLASLAYLLTFLLRNAAVEWRMFSVVLFYIPVMLVNYSFRLAENIKQSYMNTVRTLVRAIEAKDPYTRGHSEQVAELTMAMAKVLGIPKREQQKLEYVALLHDAGKIGISEDILNKKGPLTGEEIADIKKHSALGAEIVGKIKFLSAKADVVLYHHERYDGTGYPAGLKGREIPLESRIMAVADTYNAMVTDRPFRPAKTPEQAIAEMESLAGSQFDPDIVPVFKTIIKREQM